MDEGDTKLVNHLKYPFLTLRNSVFHLVSTWRMSLEANVNPPPPPTDLAEILLLYIIVHLLWYLGGGSQINLP